MAPSDPKVRTRRGRPALRASRRIAIVPPNFLEHGFSLIQARLSSPANPTTNRQNELRPFITLSRETGAGATTIGRELIPLLEQEFAAEGQGWVFLDKDLFARALTRFQLPVHFAKFLPEDRVSEIHAAIGELVGLHPSLWQLEEKVTEAILQLAHVGNAIFAGRAAFVITRDLPGSLHVRLVASKELRVARIASLLQCSPEAAEQHIRKSDRSRNCLVRTNFGKDHAAPHLYNVVINTDYLSPGSAARVIVTTLRGRLETQRAQSAAPSGVRATA